MRVVIQRVSEASVTVDGERIGEIGAGLLALVGVADGDTEADATAVAAKVVHLRIFDDDAGKMNRSLLDIGGELLAVSQFTLLGDARKGRRPSFIDAAQPDVGNQLYEAFCAAVREAGVRVATGKFQTTMDVALVNQGPVTILIDSKKVF